MDTGEITKQDDTGIIRDDKGRYVKGVSGNPDGRPETTEEKKLIQKAVKEFIKEYEQGLAEALPEIRPALIAEAKKGNVKAFHEIHAVIGAHKGGKGITVATQINFGSKDEYE